VCGAPVPIRSMPTFARVRFALEAALHLGWDISGVVEEVVPGVNRFKVGDEVFGMPFLSAR